MEWTRPTATAAPQPVTLGVIWQRVASGLFDWETMITLFLALGAVTAVSAPLEDGGWRRDMPPITTVSAIAVLTGMLLARSRISALPAWPLGILTGVAVVGWQTLSMAGPGTLGDRATVVHDRFDAWFGVISSSQVTNDPLPFNVLIIGLTWLGVMLFVWSVYRWHNAWLGLIPGGAALFLDLTLVGDNLTGAIILYMLFGFLLVMQTNLLANVQQWRREGTEYPSMINLTFLHFSTWALVILMLGAWVIPAGLKTPGPVQALAEDGLQFASRYVRLAGPLQSQKVIPIHSYSGTLPFSGSIKLGDRELMTVTVSNPTITGSLLLRGATYDEYQSGGWQIGDRVAVSLPEDRAASLEALVEEQPLLGTIVPVRIEMRAKSVVGTVVYVPGDPVSTDRNIQVQVPADSIEGRVVYLPDSGRGMSDEDILANNVGPGELGVGVLRHDDGLVTAIQVVELNDLGLLGNASLLDPGGRIKRYESYSVTGFIPETTPEMLQAAGADYPDWVWNAYLQLPDTLPQRVREKAIEWAAGAETPYDQAIAIQDKLRGYTYNPKIPETPPGQDNVDYFLFTLGQGYFDYQASAMIVMLRSLGIPARLAVGFVVDDTDRDGTGSHVVNDNDSYAWPEVYFPNVGWVPFNPTRDRDADLTPRTDASAPLSGLDHNILEDVPASVDGNVPPDGADIDDLSGSAPVPPGGGSAEQPLEWYVSAAVTAFIAALIGVIMLGWQRSVAGLPYPQQIWEKTVRLAGWGGVRPRPGQTPHDYARSLGKRFLDVRDDMPVLADAYVKSRYGHKELSEEEIAAIKDAWPEVRANLVGGITGRFFRRRREKDY
jgi:transglutaminase-like putative cysteine protease